MMTLRWIGAHPRDPTHAFEVGPDSFYVMNHTADMLPTQDWRLIPNGDHLHCASNEFVFRLTRGVQIAYIAK